MECEEHFEELVRTEGQRVACPKCETPNVLKQLSAFAISGTSSSPSFGAGGGCCGGGCGCG